MSRARRGRISACQRAVSHRSVWPCTEHADCPSISATDDGHTCAKCGTRAFSLLHVNLVNYPCAPNSRHRRDATLAPVIVHATRVTNNIHTIICLYIYIVKAHTYVSQTEFVTQHKLGTRAWVANVAHLTLISVKCVTFLLAHLLAQDRTVVFGGCV